MIDVFNTTSTKHYRIENTDYNYSPSVSLQSVDQMIKTVGVGPLNINLTTVYDLDASGNTLGNIITSSTLYYDVYSTDDSSNQTSQKYRFNVNLNQGRYSQNQIAFLNRLGNFSYYTFTCKTLKSTKQSKSSYNKNPYYLNGNTWITDNLQKGKTSYKNDVTTSYTFQSDYLTDQSLLDFLEEMFTSPEIYLLGTTVIPLEITDTEWSNGNVRNDKVVLFNIKCESSNSIKINI
jgi:hypothetical protein